MISIIMSDVIDLPPPFDSLPVSARQIHNLAPGAALFRQGDKSTALFFLHAGAIEMIRHTEAGQKVTLFRAGPGDTLAEPALFSESYHCDALAEVASRVTRIEKSAVLDLICADPAFALALVKRLSGQVQGYRRRLELTAIRSATERVMAGLADGRLTGSVVDFAAELGLTHEAVYRALAALTRDGRVERPARGVYRLKAPRQLPS